MQPTQNLSSIDLKLDRILRYKKNKPNIRIETSLSGIFKALRRDHRISYFGDYPLLNYILRNCHYKFPGHKWSKAQMYQALKFCRFWEEEGKSEATIPEVWKQYIKDE